MTAKWAKRDASWFDRPSVRHLARYHAVDEKGFAECGSPTLLCDDAAVETIPDVSKCRRCLAVLRAKAEGGDA